MRRSAYSFEMNKLYTVYQETRIIVKGLKLQATTSFGKNPNQQESTIYNSAFVICIVMDLGGDLMLGMVFLPIIYSPNNQELQHS